MSVVSTQVDSEPLPCNVAGEVVQPRAALKANRQIASIVHGAFLIYCLSAALSIALSQGAAVIAIVFWAVASFKRLSVTAQSSSAFSKPRSQSATDTALLAYAILSWVIISYISTFIGVNQARAIPEILKTSLYVLLPFCIFDVLVSRFWRTDERDECTTVCDRIRFYSSAFIAGQLMASIHSVASAIYGMELRPGVPGAVTESGQLVLVLPCVAAILFSRREMEVVSSRVMIRRALAAFGIFALILAASWPEPLHMVRGGVVHFVLIGFLIAALFAYSLPNRRRNELAERTRDLSFPLWIAGSILVSALVVNLKRGPWLAVFIEFFLLGALLSRRLVVASIFIALTLLFSIQPVRHRAGNFVEDFSISGGRSSMWQLGFDLARRYPLGLGPNNAEFMRQFDPTLPPTHRHMHNNVLNIAVESGWIGLISYLWWIALVVVIGFRCWRNGSRSTDPAVRRAALYSLGLTLGILGWQIAGLVEYNFGDGEIRLLAFMFMGLILALSTVVARGRDTSGDI